MSGIDEILCWRYHPATATQIRGGGNRACPVCNPHWIDDTVGQA
jgi:hypothetical protein